MSQMTDELAIRKSVVVSCSVEHAFRVFTEGIGGWWPFEGHSLFGEDRAGVVFEGQVGGRVYEVSESGEEGLWGTLTAWDPPHRFAMTWHPGPRRRNGAGPRDPVLARGQARPGSICCTRAGNGSATGWPRSAGTTTKAGMSSSAGTPRQPERRRDVHPYTAQQIAAERQADLRRAAARDTRAEARRPARRQASIRRLVRLARTRPAIASR